MKTLTPKQTLKTLLERSQSIIESSKNFNIEVQTFIDDFILLWGKGELSGDCTPFTNLLINLNKTDSTLIKEYFKQVTNAFVTTNKKGNLVIRLNSSQESFIINDNFNLLTWYGLAKKSKTIVNNQFESEEKAINSFNNYFKKIMKSEFDKKQLLNILQKITETFEENL